jgi:competence protein ComGC
MSTTGQPPQGQPPPPPTPPNANEIRDLLQFLRTENEANRTAVRDDAESNRRLFLDTMKIVSVPLSLIILIVTFLGIRSISDAKALIQSEARTQTQSEITRMQQEIHTRLDTQFQTPTLQKLVKDAAVEATQKSAEPLIKSEVASQVKLRVDSERPAIAAAVNQQSQLAVKQMGSQIDSLVRKSVDAKVSTDVDPFIQKIKDEADLQLLITRMNADDAGAFDTLNRLAPTSPQKDVIIAALRSVYAAHNSGMFQTRLFSVLQTDDQLVAHLSDADAYGRQAALDAIIKKKNLSLLPRIMGMMQSDPSVDVRCSAFRAFNNWTSQSFQCLDSTGAFTWWAANKQNFQPSP